MRILECKEIAKVVSNHNSGLPIDQDFLNGVVIQDMKFPDLKGAFYSAQETEFQNVIFYSIGLNMMSLSRSRFESCIFDNCQMVKSDFVGSKFEKCIFKKCKLFRSKFSGSSFRDCIFIDCDLTNMFLIESNLDNIIIRGVTRPLIKDNKEHNVIWDIEEVVNHEV